MPPEVSADPTSRESCRLPGDGASQASALQGTLSSRQLGRIRHPAEGINLCDLHASLSRNC